jgi:hypothetical protein
MHTLSNLKIRFPKNKIKTGPEKKVGGSSLLERLFERPKIEKVVEHGQG